MSTPSPARRVQHLAIAGLCALAVAGCGTSSSATSASTSTMSSTAMNTATPMSTAGVSSTATGTASEAASGVSGMTGMASASSTGDRGGASASPTFASTQLHGLVISNGYAFATTAGMGTMSAAYLTVRNTGSSDTALVGASTPAATMAQLHVTSDNGSGGGTMKEVSSLPVAAGQTLELKPGGNHIMLMDLAHPLAAGSSIQMTLRFRDGSQTTLTLPVIDRSQRPGA